MSKGMKLRHTEKATGPCQVMLTCKVVIAMGVVKRRGVLTSVRRARVRDMTWVILAYRQVVGT